MRWRLLLCAVVLVGVTALVTSEVVSQDKAAPSEGEKADQADQAEGATDTESLVETWVRYAMPTEHHRLLGKLVGNWDLAVVESEGTCRRKWVLGRRFVLEEFDGGNLGLPFQGLAIYGYDAFGDKYTSVWVDTTSTAVTTSFGTCRDECKLIAFTGHHGDPWSGTMRNSRGVTRLESDDAHVLELYEPDSGGREFKVLEIVYTRAVAASPQPGE